MRVETFHFSADAEADNSDFLALFFLRKKGAE